MAKVNGTFVIVLDVERVLSVDEMSMLCAANTSQAPAATG
jgi:hypothetical protein